jgi:hypothetical protein
LLTEYKWLLTEREQLFFTSKLRAVRGKANGFQANELGNRTENLKRR